MAKIIIPSGEAEYDDYKVVDDNKNKFRIEKIVSLTIEYPDGTQSVIDDFKSVEECGEDTHE